MFKETPEGQTHSENDGCGEPKHNNELLTRRQQNSLYLWFQMLADELNSAGWDMRKALKPEIEIPWSKESIKNFLWRPVQEIYLSKKSTTELTTKDIDAIWEILNRHLGEKFEIHIPFPSEQEVALKELTK